MRKIITLIFFVALSLKAFACFTIVVGREASPTGAVILAHNEDDWGDGAIKIWWVPAARGLERFKLLNGDEEVWKGNPEMLWVEYKQDYFADFFVNEYGVAVISNACQSKMKIEHDSGGIRYFLRRLAIERAKTAREAVKIAGALIEKHGYGARVNYGHVEGRTLTFIDSKEGWLLHILGGKHWLAWKVPDDAVVLLPNNFIAGEVDLRDRENILHSRGFLSFAVREGFLKKGQVKFNFTKTFSPNYSAPYNTGRWKTAYRILTGKEPQFSPPYPPFIKLAYKLGPKKIFEVLRSRPEEGLDFPSLLSIRSICYYTTKHSFVLSVKGHKPGDILLWFSPARPDAAPYIPIYFSARKLFAPWKGSHREILRQHFLLTAEFRKHIQEALFYPFRTYADSYYFRYTQALKKWMDLEEKFFFLSREAELRAKAMLKKGREKEAEEILENFSAGAIKMAKTQLR